MIYIIKQSYNRDTGWYWGHNSYKGGDLIIGDTKMPDPNDKSYAEQKHSQL